MVNIQNNKDCCGCEACSQICPKACIEMRTDNEGFLYPHVDFSQCINCNLCEKVCPVIHPQVPLDIQAAYGFKNPSKEIRLQSSSGGFFPK